MMKMTGLSHIFKRENLHNWWLTKYFFAPLYIYIYIYIYIYSILIIFHHITLYTVIFNQIKYFFQKHYTSYRF